MMFVSEVFGETGLERAKQQRFGDEHRTIHKLGDRMKESFRIPNYCHLTGPGKSTLFWQANSSLFLYSR